MKNQGNNDKRFVEPNFRKFFVRVFTKHWSDFRIYFFEQLAEEQKKVYLDMFEKESKKKDIEREF